MRIPKAGRKCERRVKAKSAFAKKSFRWVGSGKGRVLVGCPKGKWSERSGRCKVGLRAHAVIVARKKGGSCPSGYKRG